MASTRAFTTEQWQNISVGRVLSDEFIQRNADKLSWNTIIRTQRVSDELIVANQKRIGMTGWNFISHVYPMSRSILEILFKRYPQCIQMGKLVYMDDIDDLLERYSDLVGVIDWYQFSKSPYFCSRRHLELFADYLIWDTVSQCIPLSEDEQIQFYNRIDWMVVLRHQKVSMDVVELLLQKKLLTQDMFNVMCEHQKLDEGLFERVSFTINWSLICRHQQLSCEIMDRHSTDLDWVAVGETQRFSPVFYRKFEHMIPHTDNLQANINRWGRILSLKRRINVAMWLNIEQFVGAEMVDVA
jgi:hypothetical protein